MKILGKLLFPDSPPYEQRKKIQILLASIAVGLVISAAFVLIALKQNNRFGF